MPVSRSPKTGLIIYPGGLLDARGYSEMLKAIAREGFLPVQEQLEQVAAAAMEFLGQVRASQ